jgi:addiction module RelE/StbE family toxin
MKVVLSPQALEDLREIVGYIAEDNPEAARKLLAHVRQRIQELQDMPHLGRPGRVPGTRELVIPHTPYLVPYQVQDHCLQILRVYHGARQWPGQFD